VARDRFVGFCLPEAVRLARLSQVVMPTEGSLPFAIGNTKRLVFIVIWSRYRSGAAEWLTALQPKGCFDDSIFRLPTPLKPSTAATAASGSIRSERPDLFGQPSAVWVLAGTELWDRVSFHGMQSLLVLYMVGQLLLPGHVEHIAGFAGFRAIIEGVTGPLSVQALATQIFGLYVGLVYFTPVIGGWLGDRVLGRTAAVSLGALLMTAGHFCMAFDSSFLAAMLLLILGAGMLRGNLSPQLGEIYAPDDRRRDLAFQIYGAAVNLGAFIAPLVTGALGQTYGWHVGFAFAGFGMLFGLLVYLVGGRWAGLNGGRTARAAKPVHPKLTARDWPIVGHLLIMIPASALFWVAQSQVWNTYNLWARDHLELTYGDFTMPVPWLQSLDGLAPFLLLPPTLMLWRRQARRGREPAEATKIAIGCFIFAASTLWLAAASLVVDAHGRSPLIWAIVFHLTSNAGWIFFSPTVSALYSRMSPAAVNATLMGCSTLSVFIGSVVSGRLGGLYETLAPGAFWALHAALVGLGGVLWLVMGARLRRAFGPRSRAP
jgi:POT family proton-dependent oligopeptide transporter